MTSRTNPFRFLNTLSTSRATTLRTQRTAFIPVALTVAKQTSSTPRHQFLSTTPFLKMASDEDYMAFLNKANQETAPAKTQQSGTVKTKTVDGEVPKALKNVCKDAVYISDADEPFEEVSLKYDGGLPDEENFAKLINLPNPADADIEIQDPADWDRQGQYTDIIDAVREASRGNDVRVYKVVRDRTRVEYWVVTSEKGKILGVKALAVES
ncbi:Fc.00g014500.m01.CDS01 [Cosmosporella sp. VM-42]